MSERADLVVLNLGELSPWGPRPVAVQKVAEETSPRLGREALGGEADPGAPIFS